MRPTPTLSIFCIRALVFWANGDPMGMRISILTADPANLDVAVTLFSVSTVFRIIHIKLTYFIVETLACDHTKVTPYFIESIITKKGFWAYPCPTLISFMLNWCSPDDQDYVLMGEHVTHQYVKHTSIKRVVLITFSIFRARGVYYVRTHADPPWAQGPPLEIKQRLAKRTLPILQRLQRDFGDTRR